MNPEANDANPEPSSEQECERGMTSDNRVWLSVYQNAQTCAHHDDTVMWQVVSITWAANAALLGFALKEIFDSHGFPGVVLLSVIGISLLVFACSYFWSSKIRQEVAYKMCRKIEKKYIPEDLRLRMRIDYVYDVAVPLRSKHWVVFLTVFFMTVWLFTVGWASYLHHYTK